MVNFRVCKLFCSILILTFVLSSAVSVHATALTTTIAVGSEPVGVAYDPVMHEVFVVNYAGGDIQVISDSTNTVVADITALTQYAGAPYDLAYDSGKGEMWVTDQIGLYAIDDATNTIAVNLSYPMIDQSGLTRIAYD